MSRFKRVVCFLIAMAMVLSGFPQNWGSGGANIASAGSGTSDTGGTEPIKKGAIIYPMEMGNVNPLSYAFSVCTGNGLFDNLQVNENTPRKIHIVYTPAGDIADLSDFYGVPTSSCYNDITSGKQVLFDLCIDDNNYVHSYYPNSKYSWDMNTYSPSFYGVMDKCSEEFRTFIRRTVYLPNDDSWGGGMDEDSWFPSGLYEIQVSTASDTVLCECNIAYEGIQPIIKGVKDKWDIGDNLSSYKGGGSTVLTAPQDAEISAEDIDFGYFLNSAVTLNFTSGSSFFDFNREDGAYILESKIDSGLTLPRVSYHEGSSGKVRELKADIVEAGSIWIPCIKDKLYDVAVDFIKTQKIVPEVVQPDDLRGDVNLCCCLLRYPIPVALRNDGGLLTARSRFNCNYLYIATCLRYASPSFTAISNGNTISGQYRWLDDRDSMIPGLFGTELHINSIKSRSSFEWDESNKTYSENDVFEFVRDSKYSPDDYIEVFTTSMHTTRSLSYAMASANVDAFNGWKELTGKEYYYFRNQGASSGDSASLGLGIPGGKLFCANVTWSGRKSNGGKGTHSDRYVRGESTESDDHLFYDYGTTGWLVNTACKDNTKSINLSKSPIYSKTAELASMIHTCGFVYADNHRCEYTGSGENYKDIIEGKNKKYNYNGGDGYDGEPLKPELKFGGKTLTTFGNSIYENVIFNSTHFDNEHGKVLTTPATANNMVDMESYNATIDLDPSVLTDEEVYQLANAENFVTTETFAKERRNDQNCGSSCEGHWCDHGYTVCGMYSCWWHAVWVYHQWCHSWSCYRSSRNKGPHYGSSCSDHRMGVDTDFEYVYENTKHYIDKWGLSRQSTSYPEMNVSMLFTYDNSDTTMLSKTINGHEYKFHKKWRLKKMFNFVKGKAGNKKDKLKTLAKLGKSYVITIADQNNDVLNTYDKSSSQISFDVKDAETAYTNGVSEVTGFIAYYRSCLANQFFCQYQNCLVGSYDDDSDSVDYDPKDSSWKIPSRDISMLQVIEGYLEFVRVAFGPDKTGQSLFISKPNRNPDTKYNSVGANIPTETVSASGTTAKVGKIPMQFAITDYGYLGSDDGIDLNTKGEVNNPYASFSAQFCARIAKSDYAGDWYRPNGILLNLSPDFLNEFMRGDSSTVDADERADIIARESISYVYAQNRVLSDYDLDADVSECMFESAGCVCKYNDSGDSLKAPWASELYIVTSDDKPSIEISESYNADVYGGSEYLESYLQSNSKTIKANTTGAVLNMSSNSFNGYDKLEPTKLQGTLSEYGKNLCEITVSSGESPVNELLVFYSPYKYCNVINPIGQELGTKMYEYTKDSLTVEVDNCHRWWTNNSLVSTWVRDYAKQGGNVKLNPWGSDFSPDNRKYIRFNLDNASDNPLNFENDTDLQVIITDRDKGEVSLMSLGKHNRPGLNERLTVSGKPNEFSAYESQKFEGSYLDRLHLVADIPFFESMRDSNKNLRPYMSSVSSLGTATTLNYFLACSDDKYRAYLDKVKAPGVYYFVAIDRKGNMSDVAYYNCIKDFDNKLMMGEQVAAVASSTDGTTSGIDQQGAAPDCVSSRSLGFISTAKSADEFKEVKLYCPEENKTVALKAVADTSGASSISGHRAYNVYKLQTEDGKDFTELLQTAPKMYRLNLLDKFGRSQVINFYYNDKQAQMYTNGASLGGNISSEMILHSKNFAVGLEKGDISKVEVVGKPDGAESLKAVNQEPDENGNNTYEIATNIDTREKNENGEYQQSVVLPTGFYSQIIVTGYNGSKCVLDSGGQNLIHVVNNTPVVEFLDVEYTKTDIDGCLHYSFSNTKVYFTVKYLQGDRSIKYRVTNNSDGYRELVNKDGKIIDKNGIRLVKKNEVGEWEEASDYETDSETGLQYGTFEFIAEEPTLSHTANEYILRFFDNTYTSYHVSVDNRPPYVGILTSTKSETLMQYGVYVREDGKLPLISTDFGGSDCTVTVKGGDSAERSTGIHRNVYQMGTGAIVDLLNTGIYTITSQDFIGNTGTYTIMVVDKMPPYKTMAELKADEDKREKELDDGLIHIMGDICYVKRDDLIAVNNGDITKLSVEDSNDIVAGFAECIFLKESITPVIDVITRDNKAYTIVFNAETAKRTEDLKLDEETVIEYPGLIKPGDDKYSEDNIDLKPGDGGYIELSEGEHDLVVTKPDGTTEKVKVTVVGKTTIGDWTSKTLYKDNYYIDSGKTDGKQNMVKDNYEGYESKYTSKIVKLTGYGTHNIVIEDSNSKKVAEFMITLLNYYPNEIEKQPSGDYMGGISWTPTLSEGDIVLVDGKPVAQTPIYIGEGEHTVSILKYEGKDSSGNPKYSKPSPTKVKVTDTTGKTKAQVVRPSVNGSYVGGVKITNNDDEVTVYIDGKKITTLPVEVTDYGKHTYEEKDISGKTVYKTEFTIARETSARVNTVQKPAEDYIYNGIITINGDSSKKIYVDGVLHEERPISVNDKGQHTYQEVDKDTGKVTYESIFVIADKTSGQPEETMASSLKDKYIYHDGVKIYSGNGETVIVDGKVATDKPVSITDAGKHTITVVDKDGNSRNYTVTVSSKSGGTKDTSKAKDTSGDTSKTGDDKQDDKGDDGKGDSSKEDEKVDPTKTPTTSDGKALKDGATYGEDVTISVPEGGEAYVDGKVVKLTDGKFTVSGEGMHKIIIVDKDGVSTEYEIVIDSSYRGNPESTSKPKDSSPNDNKNEGSSSTTTKVKNTIKKLVVTYKATKSAKAKKTTYKDSKAKNYKPKKNGIYVLKYTYKNGKTKTVKKTIDKQKPVIKVKSGKKLVKLSTKKKYKRGIVLKVSDAITKITKITVNGKKQKSKSSVKLKKKGTYKVLAYDKKGNKKSVKVKVK